jgi:hypothetical protein
MLESSRSLLISSEIANLVDECSIYLVFKIKLSGIIVPVRVSVECDDCLVTLCKAALLQHSKDGESRIDSLEQKRDIVLGAGLDSR